MIDPELRLAGLAARALFRPSERFFRLVRRLDRRLQGSDVPGLECEQRWVDSLDEAVRVRARVYRRPGRPASSALPGVLFLHGGGYAMGSPEQFAPAYRLLLQTRDCVIVAPAYRKSLEAPYPAALHDCYGSLLWLKRNAAELGVREDQLIVIGQSAGGGLTAAVSLLARERGDVRIAHQLPLYPMIDHRIVTASSRDDDAPLWSSRHNRLAWDLYLRGLPRDGVPAYASPALETDCEGLPPTTTFVGELDPFLDETVAYVENLRAAGVPVELRRYPRCYHGFDIVRPGATLSRQAHQFFCERFALAVDHHFAKQPWPRTRCRCLLQADRLKERLSRSASCDAANTPVRVERIRSDDTSRW
jgi:acetyl esterase/lipase